MQHATILEKQEKLYLSNPSSVIFGTTEPNKLKTTKIFDIQSIPESKNDLFAVINTEHQQNFEPSTKEMNTVPNISQTFPDRLNTDNQSVLIEKSKIRRD